MRQSQLSSLVFATENNQFHSVGTAQTLKILLDDPANQISRLFFERGCCVLLIVIGIFEE